jgi:serine phosphatase RsbU (regulator of sigma subunit)/CheY-like chemotaxis protein
MTDDLKIQILMLEDNDSDAEMVMHALHRSGFAIEIKREELRDNFLYSLSQYTPDIIISDYNLPGYNGRQAYLDMIEMGHSIPFILVTGSLPDEIAVECLQTGIDDYIIKDRLSRLPEAVGSVLAKWRTEEEKKLALEKLVDSQKRLSEAEKLAQIGNWEWEINSGKSSWSDQMYRIFDVTPESHTPAFDSFPKFIHPDDIAKVGNAESKVASGKNDSANIKFRIITAKRKLKVIHAIYRSKQTAKSEGITLFGTLQDITQLHETEQALRELTEQLEIKVEERTEQLSQANLNLAHRNQEITDGISYARRIQKAIINKPAETNNFIEGKFNLLIPKDIVSGDFFWHHDIGNMHFIAAVDCTGHGVPGALMSMIAHQFLNQIVIEQKCYEPAEILKTLDNKLTEALHQNAEREVRDGMDIALCRIDEQEKSVQFSGALRPLFYFNGKNLVEITGSKHPIGGFRNTGSDKVFEQEKISYKPGDCIYLTSDGYYSQFNYFTGKKMMKVRMRKILESVAKKDVEEQQIILKRYFNEWKGDAEQVDDVLVIGVKL